MRRGYTMIELLAAIGLIVGLIGILGQAVTVGAQWKWTATTAVSLAERGERVAADLARLARAGRPIVALTLGEGGPVEGAAMGSRGWTYPAALVWRTEDGWVVHERAGTDLVRHEVSREGRVVTAVVAGGLEDAALRVVADAGGREAAVSYSVRFRDYPRPAQGVVALRLDEAPGGDR